MDALYRTVATVYVIKLYLLGIRLAFHPACSLYGPAKSTYIAHYLTTHREDERLFIRIGIEAYLLGEGTHLLRHRIPP